MKNFEVPLSAGRRMEKIEGAEGELGTTHRWLRAAWRSTVSHREEEESDEHWRSPRPAECSRVRRRLRTVEKGGKPNSPLPSGNLLWGPEPPLQ